MKPLSLKRVLNAVLCSLALTSVIALCFALFSILATIFGDDMSSGDTARFDKDCNQFLVIIGLYTILAIGVVIVTNLESRLPRDIDYSRDVPVMSPACATLLNDIVDPDPEGFSRLNDVGTSAMAATLLTLQEKKVIALYPGIAADYAGFDLRRPDDVALQGQAREAAEAQRSLAATAQTSAETTSESDDQQPSRRARARHKRPAPMTGLWVWFLWNTSLGSSLRTNFYGQYWLGDVSQPSSQVSTISLLPMAFEDPQTSNGLGSLSPSERAFLEFLKNFSQWEGSTVFDLNQLRSACAAEDEALAERKSRRTMTNANAGCQRVWKRRFPSMACFVAMLPKPAFPVRCVRN